ncbi:MAG: hypothetical protein LBG91_01345 [Treponema sp.]|jgi:hypothetical protein|nr:hypothetical protein [Treponema sp.]
MVRKNRKSVTFCCSLFILFISCQTTPKIPDPVLEQSGFVPLEKGALVYLLADVQAARPVLELLPIPELRDKQTILLLDSTRTAAAAIYPRESGRRFQLAAWGKYPAFRAGMAFGMSNKWKKTRTNEGVYWYSQADGLSVALDSRQAFAVSWIDTPVSPITAAPEVETPEGFGEFRRGAPLSCWIEEPGAAVNRFMESSGIPLQAPIEKIFVSLFPAPGNQYEAVIRMQFAGASQARSVAALFNLARLFMGVPAKSEADVNSLIAALFFANPPAQNGRDLDIKTCVLNEKELSLLFNRFLLY